MRCTVLLLAGLASVCFGCVPHFSMEEAQSVVAQADSLWHEGKMYGVDEGYSATLAEAYKTVEKRTHFPYTLFSPRLGIGVGGEVVSYHYGRLLRAKDNPVEAMQVFIAATHMNKPALSPSLVGRAGEGLPYHILGRIYSNMGDMCHMAGDFSLSYDMFERSAEMFLQNGDTILYYYDLNNMAYEQAEQGKKDETLLLINRIEESCTDADVLTKVQETMAELYLKCQQYDSALYHAYNFYNKDCSYPAITLIIAQSYSHLGVKDSAVHYANIVLSQTSELHALNNALYILTNEDETKDIKAVQESASQRADVQKLLEIRHGKLSQAVQILQQDLARKPDYRWLYLFVSIILFVATLCVIGYLWRNRRKHTSLLHEIKEQQLLQSQLQGNITDLTLRQQEHRQLIIEDIEATCSALLNAEDFQSELCWKDYDAMHLAVNKRLYNLADKLDVYALSEKEMRLCVLILLKASTQQMVEMLPYSKSGLGKLKFTTARQLGTNTKNIRSFILHLLGENDIEIKIPNSKK